MYFTQEQGDECMKVACLGYGVVGKGVVELLDAIDFIEVKWILNQEITCGRFTCDMNTILEDEEVDVVIEMIGGVNVVVDYLTKALKHQKHVVTSNKAVVANCFQRWLDLANENGVQFRYEASVGGGIPWIHSLLQQRRIGSIHRIEGIVNGTTNYILDQMHSRHEEYDVILKEAQSLGYAEKNPTMDVDGFDGLFKLVISSSLAFGGVVEQNKLFRFGLGTLTLDDLLYFEKHQLRLRYYVSAFCDKGRYAGSVEPTLFEENTQQALVPLNQNLMVLHQDTLGVLQLMGQGAGRYPTANAVVQDVLDIYEGKQDIVLLNQALQYDDELLMERLCICTNLQGIECFEPYVVRMDIGKRCYGWTKPITQKIKRELIAQVCKVDEQFFYAVVK